MTKHPPADRDTHEKFCLTEGWTPVLRADGSAARHHVTFHLRLADGSVLRTRISRPVDRTTYGPSIWAHILRDQLAVTNEEFWACVNDGVLPPRSAPEEPTSEGLPLYLMNELVRRVGLRPEDAIALTTAEATERLAAWWAENPR